MAIFAQENLLSSSESTVTASSENASYPVANVYSGFLFDSWSPASSGISYVQCDLGSVKTFNYLGIAQHNLYSSGVSTVLITTSVDGATYTSAQSFALSSDKNYLGLFDTITTRYVRIQFNATVSAPKVAQISIGTALVTSNPDYGYAPPVVNNEDKIVGNSNVNGVVLGQTVISGGASTSVNISYQSDTLAFGDWATFVETSTEVPFFYSWDSDNPGQIMFGRAEKKENPVCVGPGLFNISMKINGLIGSGANYISDPDSGGGTTPPTTTTPFTADSTIISADSTVYSADWFAGA